MDELEILKIAHETDPSFTARTYYADILKFAKAIAIAEREACAALCEENDARWDKIGGDGGASLKCAEAIRSRSNVGIQRASPASGEAPLE